MNTWGLIGFGAGFCDFADGLLLLCESGRCEVVAADSGLDDMKVALADDLE